MSQARPRQLMMRGAAASRFFQGSELAMQCKPFLLGERKRNASSSGPPLRGLRRAISDLRASLHASEQSADDDELSEESSFDSFNGETSVGSLGTDDDERERKLQREKEDKEISYDKVESEEESGDETRGMIRSAGIQRLRLPDSKEVRDVGRDNYRPHRSNIETYPLGSALQLCFVEGQCIVSKHEHGETCTVHETPEKFERVERRNSHGFPPHIVKNRTNGSATDTKRQSRRSRSLDLLTSQPVTTNREENPREKLRRSLSSERPKMERTMTRCGQSDTLPTGKPRYFEDFRKATSNVHNTAYGHRPPRRNSSDGPNEKEMAQKVRMELSQTCHAPTLRRSSCHGGKPTSREDFRRVASNVLKNTYGRRPPTRGSSCGPNKRESVKKGTSELSETYHTSTRRRSSSHEDFKPVPSAVGSSNSPISSLEIKASKATSLLSQSMHGNSSNPSNGRTRVIGRRDKFKLQSEVATPKLPVRTRRRMDIHSEQSEAPPKRAEKTEIDESNDLEPKRIDRTSGTRERPKLVRSVSSRR